MMISVHFIYIVFAPSQTLSMETLSVSPTSNSDEKKIPFNRKKL